MLTSSASVFAGNVPPLIALDGMDRPLKLLITKLPLIFTSFTVNWFLISALPPTTTFAFILASPLNTDVPLAVIVPSIASSFANNLVFDVKSPATPSRLFIDTSTVNVPLLAIAVNGIDEDG